MLTVKTKYNKLNTICIFVLPLNNHNDVLCPRVTVMMVRSLLLEDQSELITWQQLPVLLETAAVLKRQFSFYLSQVMSRGFQSLVCSSVQPCSPFCPVGRATGS